VRLKRLVHLLLQTPDQAALAAGISEAYSATGMELQL
jgi:hypothetical protein